jgi:uncharacterized repeat protein (TIGR01451 family)
LALMLIATFSVAQTPCEGFSATIVASGYNTTNDGYYQQCVGGDMTFTIENIAAPNGYAIDSVQWVMNGYIVPEETGNSITVSYSMPMLIQVSANIISMAGCSNTLVLNMPVAYLENPQPVFGTQTTACLQDGQSVIQVNGLNTVVVPRNNFGVSATDFSGNSMIYDFNVAGFTQPHITDCDDLDFVHLNFEHSAAMDLEIKLVCPSGASAKLIRHPNSLLTVNFGYPVVTDEITAGEGLDYYWSMDATNPPLDATLDHGTNYAIPSDTYRPYESFCNLVGCPVNGTWRLYVTDNYAGDNGFVFQARLSFELGVADLSPYNYTYSSANEYSWTSNQFTFSNSLLKKSNVHAEHGTSGTISYSYTNPAGCTGNANKNLTMIDIPFAVIMGDDLLYEEGGNNVVSAQTVQLTEQFYNVQKRWSPASAVATYYNSSTEALPPSEDIWLKFTGTVTQFMSCSITDSLLVSIPSNSVYLTVFHDANENGEYDQGEYTMPMFAVDCGDLGTIYTNAQGRIFTSLGEATYFEVNVDGSNWELTTPAHVEVDESGWNGYAVYYYIGVKPTANIQVEAEVSLSGIEEDCNSLSFPQIKVFNSSHFYPGGTVEVTIDPLYTFVSASTLPIAVQGNVYTFSVPSLHYHQQYTVSMVLQNPDEQAFGSQTSHQAVAFYTVSQGVLSDALDTDYVNDVIVCAYDPNDKITHTGVGDEGFIYPNTDLEYTINFQNIGNAPATNVILTDELSNLLDMASLQPIAWSHNFVLQVVDNIATFRFEDIQLLGIEQDEQLSKGFVRFKIKQQPNLVSGTVIENTAEIVFDNNEAIITNTAINTIATSIGVVEVVKDMLTVYPNPAHDALYWSNPDYRLTKVINAMGMIVAMPSNYVEMQFNISNLVLGTYVFEFENMDGTVVRKRIIKS